jgi:peptide/nickel transport system substrate-binding protein
MSKKKFTDTSLSRRRFLGTSGAGVAAAMLGGGVLPAGFGRAVMAQDGEREFHSAWPYVDLGAGGHFNTFVTNGIMNPPNIYGDIMWVPGALLYWADNSYMPLVAESWQFITTGFADAGATPAATPAASPVTGDADVAAPELNAEGRLPSAGDTASSDADTLRVNLRQGVMWSNGEELTAQDFLDTFSIYRLQSNTMWDYIADIEALDDYTLNVYMQRRSTVVERYVIRASLRPSSVYGEIAERAREVFDTGATNTDDAWVQLVQEFNEFRPTEQVVNGPFMIDPDSITNAQMTMVKNDTSYWADNVNFDRIINYNGETDTISAVVLSGDVDYATHGFAPATERSMMEQGIRVLRAPTYSGPALKFNFRALPALADKRVRQAIAHVIDRNENGFVSLAESGVGVEYMSGMSDNFTDTWLSEDVVSQLNRYEHDLDGATALLEEAGWTKDGDQWMDADGNPAEYELIFPSEFADWSAAGANVAEQLTAFGITVSPRPITFTQIGTDVLEGRFQMAIQGWGNSANPHPHYSYFQAFFFQNTRTDAPSDRGMDFPLVQETEVMGEVDIDELVVATGEGMNADEQRELVGQAALVFNELLNIIPLFERYGNNAVLEGVRVQPWPDDDAPIMQNSFYADGIVTILMLDGTLQPVE